MFLNIGFGSYVNTNTITKITSEYKKGYIAKLIDISKLKNKNIEYDFSMDKGKETALLLKSKKLLYSPIREKELTNRLKKQNMETPKTLFHLGRDNYITIDSIEFLTGNIKSKPIVRKVKESKENNTFIDFTNNNPTRSFLFMKDGKVYASSMDEHTIIKNIEKQMGYHII